MFGKRIDLKKNHRVLYFQQDNFFMKYIQLNTHLRKVSKSKFEKDQFKLFFNAVFGKDNRKQTQASKFKTS